MRVICRYHETCKDVEICKHSKVHNLIEGNGFFEDCFLNKSYTECVCVDILEQRKLKLEKINGTNL